jgi:proline iminopeptidase
VEADRAAIAVETVTTVGEVWNPRSRSITINGVDLYVREVGAGRPIIVLHGGPDFDHTYLLPELDQLADSCRLVYYDQRGRGRSATGVRPEDVSIESEVADLDQLRDQLGLDSVALMGHSWGAVLAMEYTARHPERVSHLILMNTAPASGWEGDLFRAQLRASRPAGDVERMADIVAGAQYEAGEPEAETAYYRIHFRGAVQRPDQLEQIVGRLRTHFTADSVRTARAVEDRLYEQTWRSAGYDLVPRLRGVHTSTLVIHGEHDLVPVEMAARIADAIPGSRLEVLTGCGHFAYLERPEVIHRHVRALINTS